MTQDPVAGVTNPGVRAAVEAFAAEPSAQRSLDVLRACLHGQLLLDISDSEITYADGQMQAGSSIRIAGATGPDGGNALVAFTSQAEVARMHADGEQVQTLVQDAAAVLELAQSQDHRWLYLDPAGPTCALSRDEIDFALRVPRNDAVRAVVEAASVDPARKPDLVSALRAEGHLVLATSARVPPQGETLTEDTKVDVATTELPDGRRGLLAFTSGPEAAARAPGDGLAVLSTAEVLEMATGADLSGIVINAAGPWVALTVDELKEDGP